jgi:hypothetical protein
VSANQLTASVPAALVASPGTAFVNVSGAGANPPASLPFTITSTGTHLSLTSITPGSLPAGGPSTSLLVDGSGFDSGTTIFWNNIALPGILQNGNQITVTVAANLIAQPGVASITAQEAGQSSNAIGFNITAAQLTLSSITPNGALAGGPAFVITANGSGFTAGTSITWNGVSLSTSFVSPIQITAGVAAAFIAKTGTASVSVAAPSLISPAPLPFTINQTLILTSLSSTSAVAGGPAFTLTVNGTGLGASATVFWNAIPLAAVAVGATQMSLTVPASLLSQPGLASITAQNGGETSNALTFNVINPVLTLTSLSPSLAPVGSQPVTLTVNGTGFLPGTTVTWNGTALLTSFVSLGQLTATIPAALLNTAGTFAVSVTGGPQPASLPFVVTSQLLLTSLAPSSTPAAGSSFSLVVNGGGFTAGTTVFWNTTALTTSFVSLTQVNASVPASLIAQSGTASITAADGALVSNALTFTIGPPGPTITSLSPSSAAVGAPAFTLTVNGTGFLATSGVTWNNTNLTTTFVSATQLTAAIPANLIAQIGTATIVVANGSVLSNSAAFIIAQPTPIITSLSPSTFTLGGASFNVTINGSGFQNGATASLGTTPLATTFVSATQLTAFVPASLLTQPGPFPITVTNLIGPPSNAMSIVVTGLTPTITSVVPPTVGPGDTITVTGTNFVPGSTIYIGTTPLPTTFVDSTHLTATLPPDVTPPPGTLPITVVNPGGPPSNPAPVVVTPPVPTITTTSPTNVPLGGPAFTLTVTGSNFVAGATVFLGTTALPTTFMSPTQVTAAVPANLIQQPGPTQITVTNPGTAPSNAAPFTIVPPAPTLTSVSPSTLTAGGPAVAITITGTNFLRGATAYLNGSALVTTFVSATQVTAQVTADLIAQPGPTQITVANVSGPQSQPLALTVAPAVPVISSLSPSSATAGDPGFTLVVNGTGFLPGVSILWNGTALTTSSNVTPTQVTADVPASLLAQPGTAAITAVNPGNLASAAVTFTINPLAITSLSKTSAVAGDTAFTLVVTGTGFEAGAVVNFGTNTLVTTFVSSTQLSAAVTANLLLIPNTYQIVVQQPGEASNQVAFAVNLPAPPALRLGAPITSLATQQPTIDFGLNAPYPLALTATVTITFVSNASTPADDPMILFAGGGRTMTFTIPANSTTAPTLQIQTGTTAGIITLTVKLTAAGIDVTPSNSTTTVTIARSAPVIISGGVKLIRNGSSIEVDITGYSNTRDVTQAVFHFNGSSATAQVPADVTVPLTTIFNAWYQSAASLASGSQFTYAQPFTVTGDPSQIASITVTLTNSVGNSQPMTSN